MTARRILIIDDDIELCDELADSLNSEGYSAESVSDPVKGEELIRAGGHDIILLDYKMLVIGALEILKKLKADKVRKRIFIVSGRPYLEQTLREERVLDMIVGIIAKPIHFETLLNKISEPRPGEDFAV